VCSVNIQTKIITVKRPPYEIKEKRKRLMLSVMLFYQNKLEIMSIISVYSNNVHDNNQSYALIILYKIAILRWIILRCNAHVLDFVSKLVKILRKLLNGLNWLLEMFQ